MGINGINVNDITTGLPNINITNFTGLSGGPNFLPVNPKQWHYQIEDALVWLKGRHQLKFGYRLVDRFPSPFTHTDTRSTITFGNSFVNNPLTNSGGTGLAAVLLGYFNGATRGFLLEPYTLRVIEHGSFIQDDFKVNSRLTINAGRTSRDLRRGPTEEAGSSRQLRLRQLPPRLRGSRRHDARRQQEDALLRFCAAPRSDL